MKTIGERFIQVLWWIWVFLLALITAATWSDIGIIGALLAGPVIGIPIWLLQRTIVGYWSVAHLFGDRERRSPRKVMKR